MTISIAPAIPDVWSELGGVYGPRGKKVDSCWCQRFRHHDEVDNREALRREIVGSAVPVGLLARVDEQVVGWTRVVPRASLPGITGNRALARLLDDDPDAWWVTCFVVRREHRGTGVGTALLRAAVDWAAEHGASVVEGHPVDTGSSSAGPASPSSVFTGVLAMFLQLGFEEVGRTRPTRPLMRRVLSTPV